MNRRGRRLRRALGRYRREQRDRCDVELAAIRFEESLISSSLWNFSADEFIAETKRLKDELIAIFKAQGLEVQMPELPNQNIYYTKEQS